jgi:glycosyltransferase involved in cell wall biosynthesis
LIFVSRLLKQKGLGYLIEAVTKINSNNLLNKVNLVVVGWIDPNNPDSYSEIEMENFSKLNHISFLGKRVDIDELISFSDIATLPTFYREGTPRFLLESMAIGKPIITTDMPGCNHLIKNNKNGLLVLPKSSDDLVKAIEMLLEQDLKKLGDESRRIYEKEFSEKVVYNQLLEIYSY